MAPQIDVELPTLSKGEYIVLYAARFSETDNPLRKMVLNVYAPDPIKLQRLPSDAGLNQVWQNVDVWMKQRFNAGSEYKQPKFAMCE